MQSVEIEAPSQTEIRTCLSLYFPCSFAKDQIVLEQNSVFKVPSFKPTHPSGLSESKEFSFLGEVSLSCVIRELAEVNPSDKDEPEL